jgi:hypothetical protein
MLTLTATKHADWQTHTISRAHIARYPGSLLASLCDAVQPDVACDVTLDLSASLGDSPLASWAPAAAITASIFRCAAWWCAVCINSAGDSCNSLHMLGAGVSCSSLRNLLVAGDSCSNLTNRSMVAATVSS